MQFALTRCVRSLAKKLGASYSDLDRDKYSQMMAEHFRTKTPFKPHFALIDENSKIWLWATDSALLGELQAQAKKGKAS